MKNNFRLIQSFKCIECLIIWLQTNTLNSIEIFKTNSGFCITYILWKILWAGRRRIPHKVPPSFSIYSTAKFHTRTHTRSQKPTPECFYCFLSENRAAIFPLWAANFPKTNTALYIQQTCNFYPKILHFKIPKIDQRRNNRNRKSHVRLIISVILWKIVLDSVLNLIATIWGREHMAVKGVVTLHDCRVN